MRSRRKTRQYSRPDPPVRPTQRVADQTSRRASLGQPGRLNVDSGLLIAATVLNERWHDQPLMSPGPVRRNLSPSLIVVRGPALGAVPCP
jgi:hypothetical protein